MSGGESLTKAGHGMGFVVDDLTEANVSAPATLHLLLLPLIKRAAELDNDIDALLNAIAADDVRSEDGARVRENRHRAASLALELLASGCARIERSGTLVEFCFDGLRYSHRGNWPSLIAMIGEDKAKAAIAQARARP